MQYNRLIAEEHVHRTLQGMETDSDDELDAVVKRAYVWMRRADDSGRSGVLLLPPGYGVIVAVEDINDLTVRDVVAAEICDVQLPEPPKDPNADPPRDDDPSDLDDDPQR